MTEQLALIGPDAAEHAFRPIHYLGNKSRVLDAIQSAVGSVAVGDGPVCDLFTGSGVVARHLGRRRSVIAADIQEYSRVVTSALLSPVQLPPELAGAFACVASEHERRIRESCPPGLLGYEDGAISAALASRADALCDIIEHGSALAVTAGDAGCPEKLAAFLRELAASMPPGPDTVITRYYGGIYYSYRQAIALDSVAAAIRALPAGYRDVALAALLSTASELVSTVGNQFAQPIRPRGADGRPKAGMIAAVARKRQQPVAGAYLHWLARYQALSGSGHDHRVIRGDFRDVFATLPDDLAAVYADPPYTRDHYSRFYHVLETIALGDEPEISTMKLGQVTQLSRALYRKERHQSPFCIRTQAEGAFHDLFSSVVKLDVPLVLSYSPHSPGTAARPSTRLLTVPRLVDLAAGYFSDVRVQPTGRVAHSKLNAEHLNAAVSYDAEILIIAVP